MEDKRAELFRCGKELFSLKGFKDTTVADITNLAGVSVGTFYNYFPSKEKLFMEIFKEENGELKKSMEAVMDPLEDPVSLVKRMLAINMAGMKENPILCQWYNKDVYHKLEKLFKDENALDAVHFLYGDTVGLVAAWQAEGRMRSDIDSGMIMAIFTAIMQLDMHKEEIGLKYFPGLQNIITEFVMKGLTDTRPPSAGG